MGTTPADVKCAHRGSEMRVSYYKKDLVAIQNLFLDRRYKQCIASCERLQQVQLHGLPRAFLWFHHAISYESMGLLAHKFSQNKLQFLDSARASFSHALNCLPLPYASLETGSYEQQDDSPLTPDFHCQVPLLTKLCNGSAPFTPCNTKEVLPPSTIGSVYSEVSPVEPQAIQYHPEVASGSTAEDDISEDNDSEEDFLEPYQSEDEMCSTPTQSKPLRTPATHKTRLGRALSSPKILQKNLVPSPLFSRKPKPTLSETLVDGELNPRPLPPLQFNQNPNIFTVEGNRIIQDPLLRKTAVQTLIARFEGILPLPPSTSFKSPSEDLQATPGITTPRFRMIHEAFSLDPSNEHLEAYLSSEESTRLSSYNNHLADFANQLRKHIAYVEADIDKVHTLQAERAASRSLGPKQRLASFWSFDASNKSPCPIGRGRANQENPDCEIAHNGDEGDVQEKTKKARIEKLRAQGWHVRKENHGYKGTAFYDDLVRCVEAELALA